MPIYEYVCQACGQPFERLVRLSTPTESIACPHCGERQAQRVLSAFSMGGGGIGGGAATSGSSSGCGSGFS